MSKEIIKRGATSNLLRVFLQDNTVTTGAGKTGLTSASAGLIISTIADVEATATTYTAAATNVETITTLGTYAAPTAGKCRFREVDATNHPGLYEIQIADARYNVANSTQLIVSIQATGIAPVYVEYQLVLVDFMDTVRFGLTALPNVASGSAGAIITSGTGTAQLSTTSGNVTVGTNNDKTGYSLSTSQTFSTTGSVGSVTGAVGSVTGAVGSVTGAVGSVSGDVSGKVLGGGAGTITGDGVRAASVTGAVGSVTAAVTVGTNNDKTGYSLSGSQTFSTTGSVGSVTGAVGSVSGDVSGKVLGGGAGTITGDGVRAASVTGNVGGSVGSVTGNVGGNVVGSVASVTNAVTVGTINANAINAAAIATDAIDSDAIAASAVAEIQSGLSTLTAAQAENAVWNAATSAHTTAGTYGQLIVRTDGTNGNEVKVTAAHHIAADVHEVQPGTFVDADWAAGSTYSKLATLIEADTPTGYRYTAQALEQAPAGGGGGGGSTTVRMGPFEVKADGGGSDQPLDIQTGATHGVDCILIDGSGTGIDLTGATLTAKVYNTAGTLVATVTGTATYAAGGAMTWTIPTSVTNTAGTYTATITRTTGASDTQVFGQLRIYVREV